MRFLILDVYPIRSYRVTKDSNGGFGTANDYGHSLVPRLLKYLVARTVDWPPLNAVHTAGVLQAAGHEVEYARSYDGGSYDFCLLPTSIVAHETELAAARRVLDAGLPVIAMGPFATVMPQPYVDVGAIVLSGEPEMFFHEFDDDRAALLAAGPIVAVDRVVPLDELAYPGWDVVFRSHPPKMGFIGGGRPTLPMLATRGCPYSCFKYCTYPLQQGRTVRSRDPKAIVQEMMHWQDTLGVSSFVFRDPVFSINRKHTLALCDAIDASGRTFRFVVETHLKNLDAELVDRLHAAGLRLVYVGIETASPEVLKDVDRFSIASDEQVSRIRYLESMGIAVKTMFIFGFPSDTKETIQRTFKYARTICAKFAQFSVFTPYPGTPIFAEFKDKITVEKFEDFTQWNLVYRHDALTPDDIRNSVDSAYSKYYSSVVWLAKFLRSSFVH
jgi:radical SAM superfamily enzyme YgiQ (UPF0313 family)